MGNLEECKKMIKATFPKYTKKYVLKVAFDKYRLGIVPKKIRYKEIVTLIKYKNKYYKELTPKGHYFSVGLRNGGELYFNFRFNDSYNTIIKSHIIYQKKIMQYGYNSKRFYLVPERRSRIYESMGI